MVTLVMVSRIAWRSAGGGKPTYSVLSKRPGRSTAGSMMSRRENENKTLIKTNHKMYICSDSIIIEAISLLPGNSFTAKPRDTSKASDKYRIVFLSRTYLLVILDACSPPTIEPQLITNNRHKNVMSIYNKK